MKKILVPTDFSEQAENALDVAYKIARRSNATITLLNVIESPGGSASFDTMGGASTIDPMDNVFIVEMMKSMKNKMDEVVNNSKYSDVNLEHEVRVGNPFSSISSDVVKHEMDLVVMGSRGSSGVEEVLIGSNTEKVVRRAKCPVLTVKNKINIDAVKDIVFASDFKEDQAEVIRELKKLQQLFGAKLHMVKVNTPNNFSSERDMKRLMQDFVDKNQVENYDLHIYNDVVEEDGIIYFAEDINADMIALATHGRTGLMHLLSGSIAEDVVNHSKRPVWTYRIHH